MSFPKDIFTRMFSNGSGLLYPKQEEREEGNFQELGEVLETNLFKMMLNRRSQRKFEKREVEDWKLDMIIAAADTAPTAGGFRVLKYHM